MEDSHVNFPYHVSSYLVKTKAIKFEFWKNFIFDIFQYIEKIDQYLPLFSYYKSSS